MRISTTCQRLVLWLLLLCLLPTDALGQIAYEKRLEMGLFDQYSHESVWPFSDPEGFILRRQTVPWQKEGREQHYTWYNSDMDSVGNAAIMAPHGFRVETTQISGRHLLTLLKSGKKYRLHVVEAGTLATAEQEGFLPGGKAQIENLVGMGEVAYLHAQQRGVHFLYAINWKTGTRNVVVLEVPGYSKRRVEVIGVEPQPGTQEVLVYLKGYRSIWNSQLFVMHLDADGKRKALYEIAPKEDVSLVTASGSSLGNGTYLFAGTYSSRRADVAEGLYFCKVQGKQVQFITLHNFSKMANFFKYLPKNKQKAVKKKAKKKAAKGKAPAYRFRMVLHPVQAFDSGYVLLAEAYQPVYSTTTSVMGPDGIARTLNTTTSVMSLGVMPRTMNTRTRQIGNVYSHATLVKFDQSGKRLWDQVFKMDSETKPIKVDRYVSMALAPDQPIGLMFIESQQFLAKTISPTTGKVLSEKKSGKIETGQEGDKASRTRPQVDRWYGPYFLASGTQRVKNKTEQARKKNDGESTRNVFFISKIRYE